MNELTLLDEDVKEGIGIEKEYAEPIEVEKGAIRRYAETIMDLNPLYIDEKYAQSRGFSSVVAPPLFLCGFPPTELRPPIPEGLTGVHGGDEWELFRPVAAGDVITRKGKLANIIERVGSSGRMVFLTMEVDFTNQREELVARYRPTVIYRPKPEVK